MLASEPGGIRLVGLSPALGTGVRVPVASVKGFLLPVISSRDRSSVKVDFSVAALIRLPTATITSATANSGSLSACVGRRGTVGQL